MKKHSPDRSQNMRRRQTMRARAALDIQPDGTDKLDPCKMDGDKCTSGIEADRPYKILGVT